MCAGVLETAALGRLPQAQAGGALSTAKTSAVTQKQRREFPLPFQSERGAFSPLL